MAFENRYKAKNKVVYRWMRDRWSYYKQYGTEKDADQAAKALSIDARRLRREAGVTREKKGAYGKSYPEVRTRPAEEKALAAKKAADARAKARAKKNEAKPRVRKSAEKATG